MILILILIFVVVAMADIQKRENEKKAKEIWAAQPSAKRMDVPGSARFVTEEKELKQAGLLSGKGVLIGHSATDKALKYNGDGMMITVAPVGSGKGTAQVVPNLLGLDDWSILLLSLKGESAAVGLHHRKSLGPVYHLNPFEAHMPSFRGIPQAFHNDMDVLSDPREPELNLVPNTAKIAEGISFHDAQHSEDAFFINRAKALVQGVVLGVALHEPKEKRSLIRVAEIISTPEMYDWSKRICGTTRNDHVRQMLGSFATGKPGDRTLEGILETARDNVSFFSEPAMVNCMSKSTFQFRELRERLCTVAITVPVHRADHGGRFLRLKLSSALGQLLTPGRGKKRVLVICDDFSSYGALPMIEKAQGIAREFGVTIWVVLQDLSQLSGRYPHTWQTFLSNAGVRTFMTPQDEMTAEYVSKQCGYSQVVKTTPSMTPDPHLPRISWSRHISKQELLLPHQTREIPNDRMLLFVRGLPPILRGKRRASRIWGGTIFGTRTGRGWAIQAPCRKCSRNSCGTGSIEMTMKYGQNHMLDLIRPANAKLVEELVAAGAVSGCALIAPSNFVIGCGGRI